MSSHRARDGARFRDSNCLSKAEGLGPAALLLALIEEVRGLRADLHELADAHSEPAAPVATGARESEGLLTASELAAHLQVHPRTLRQFRRAGEVPEPVLVGRSPRWRPEAVRDWLATQGRSP